ncbi:GW domain-containing glycosaminoglycan-binding protein, partial [Listeria innocua]
LREAKTPITTWYQFSIDGKTIGWVDTRALDTFYKQSMEKDANLTRYVASNKTGEAYYKVPVVDADVKWGTIGTYKSEKLTVDKQATVEGQLWYRVKAGSTFIGWTKASNLTATSPFDKIEYDKGVTAYARVKTAPGNAVWTKPYRTEGSKLVNQLSVYQGKNMRILREAKTPITTWYQFSIDGKVIGWVDTRALDTFYKQSMEQSTNLTRYVTANKTGEAYYKVPVADSDVKWGTLATYKNEKLTVDSQATVEGQLWYRVRTSTTFIGWTKAENLTTTPPFDAIEYDKGVTAYARVKTAPGNAVWTKPYRTEGSKLVNQLSVYQGKNMRILREAKTVITTWYQFSIDGKVIGWVDTRALDTFYKQSMEKDTNLTRYVIANKVNEAYYKVPVVDADVRWGTLAAYKGQKLTVDKQATVEGQLWYRIRTSSTFIGWTKASNLSATK